MNKCLQLILVLFLCFSCSEEEPGNETENLTISAEARNYLNEVLEVMEENALYRNTINWTDFRNEVFEVAGAAQTIDQVYSSGSMLRALELLGDNHSFIERGNGAFISASTADCPFPNDPIGLDRIPDNIGYIFVRGFTGSSESTEAMEFAENLHNIIREKDSPDLIGWIVDLRPNTGGNMFPMLAGIGPILGEGIAGYFVGPEGEERSWSYEAGISFTGNIPVLSLEEPYTLFNENPKVAVLYSVATASSGEAIAISFINRPDTSSFGTPTCGLSTGNGTFQLSDNSRLALTQVFLADRLKNAFGEKIQPDFPATDEEIIDLAVAFLQNN
ncbi:Peptidase family S41 [Robiginitalea myxolifaciens]|uniref:Peptidase family S41 n=2 Tax=Robiginitalea myxolifaciens TaxID=400055 RepID=A0A1I6GZ61_9FLAO|nr:Peptidase family S41 [Robiginitalea myxolifaciens]